ncbi:fatty acyl-CoA hydrolase precursor, medium chain-like [Clupea harengus]|uniref:Carboxylic ester hydrolase n=1 Tax=Clupea harengus TaxID=7950 RepID=A0A6P8G6B7_CLUHA|nr:fatty acyl-CoA hydrolase precursor, medium chain-like [Clupea harengus]
MKLILISQRTLATMKLLIQLILVAGVAYVTSSTAHDGPLIHTKLGALRGEYLRVRGKTTVVHSYLGVPFAKPPVGPLRLARPQPVQGWEGVRDATKQPYMCVQNRQMSFNLSESLAMDVEIPEVSEDCLYLNVYTPARPAEDAKLPVMVWIHGGAFAIGSASFYDGSVLAAYQNVVVVLIQYRLGMLGLFSTGDDNAPGNMGLLDQVAALQWVQENIQSFGGDPSSVTIFGESAGGMSVSLQVLSPLSSGLFHRGIAESGTAALDEIISEQPLAVAMMVANASDCAGTKPHEMVDCVMQMSTEDVLKITENPFLMFGITVDKHFLPKPAQDLMKSHEFNKVPLINGINNDECGWLVPASFSPPGWVDGMDPETIKQSVALFFPNVEDSRIIDLILEEYLGTGEDGVKNRDGFTELIGDIMFNIPAIKLSNAHRDSGAPVYMYEFQHPPSILSLKRPSFVKADHGDELPFVFGECFMKGHVKRNGTFTEEEDELCRTVMSYWGNFARTGSPNGAGLTHWPMYGAGGEYLEIGLKQQVGNHLRADRFTFWTETFPKNIQEKKQRSDEL